MQGTKSKVDCCARVATILDLVCGVVCLWAPGTSCLKSQEMQLLLHPR